MREVIADVDDEAPSQFIVGERAGPRVPIIHLLFLHIDRWHRPTAEELVARGKALGVFS